MFKNILVPLDGSELAEQSIPMSMDLAKNFKAKITLIQIAEILPLLKKDREAQARILLDQGRRYLSQIKEKMEKEGVETDVVVKMGKPDVEICAYAERSDVDLIVMSTHGWSGITSWAIGAVSDKVIRHSPKPVLMLRSYSKDILSGKRILAVDDEPDVLETLEEILDTCMVDKATSYSAATDYLAKCDYDIVILDIMGVNGFDLLKQTVGKGIPTVMLSAHALNPESLRKSMKSGAVFFIPKDKLKDIEKVLVDLIQGGGKPLWGKLFWRFASYFRGIFGWGKEDEEEFLKEVEEVMKASEKS